MTLRTLVLVAGVLALPWPASAQGTPAADSPWASWLGCWDLRTENLTDGELDPVVAAARNAVPSTRNGGIRICVTPTDDAKTVRHQTIVKDETVLEETITADGRDGYPVEPGRYLLSVWFDMRDDNPPYMLQLGLTAAK